MQCTLYVDLMLLIKVYTEYNCISKELIPNIIKVNYNILGRIQYGSTVTYDTNKKPPESLFSLSNTFCIEKRASRGCSNLSTWCNSGVS